VVVFVLLYLGMGFGRMVRHGHRRHGQQNKQNRYDRAHGRILRGGRDSIIIGTTPRDLKAERWDVNRQMSRLVVAADMIA
jgi:hypothetical protein